MSNNQVKGSRKIKILGKTYKKGDAYLHPLTLQFTKYVNQDQLTPSELHFEKNKNVGTWYVNEENVNYTEQEIQKYIALPYLNLNYHSIVNFYEIYDIDSFNNLIDLKINAKNPIDNIIRIINVWIKYNFNDLKKYNNYILNLFKKINEKYWNKKYDEDKLKKFIDTWINNKNIDDFEFNIFDDILKFI